MIQALRALVWRLRRSLGPSIGPRYLQRQQVGYALAVPARLTDHGQLTAQILAAHRQVADGAPSAAIVSFEAALALWRGEPWEDLGYAAGLAGIRSRLTELRDSAVDELQATRLFVGDTARAIAELSEATEAAPYRERRWELLALGLYRSGRQSDALSVLRRARDLLVGEVGVDPGPALRALEERILRQDPDLFDVVQPRISYGAHLPTLPEPCHSL
ncbi:BTAD domain-containing putative transcriptional regulator [Nocardia salmonicida]|uniref:AfsR/SARP family transcriptional regulator n=1 Tax=Nocardia salmonicida TaxID=53431 RepID=UPI003670683B